MKVWLVLKQHDYEGFCIDSIHASEAGANTAKLEVLRLREAKRRKMEAYFASEDESAPCPTSEEIDAECDDVSVEQWEVRE